MVGMNHGWLNKPHGTEFTCCKSRLANPVAGFAPQAKQRRLVANPVIISSLREPPGSVARGNRPPTEHPCLKGRAIPPLFPAAHALPPNSPEEQLWGIGNRTGSAKASNAPPPPAGPELAAPRREHSRKESCATVAAGEETGFSRQS